MIWIAYRHHNTKNGRIIFGKISADELSVRTFAADPVVDRAGWHQPKWTIISIRDGDGLDTVTL